MSSKVEIIKENEENEYQNLEQQQMEDSAVHENERSPSPLDPPTSNGHLEGSENNKFGEEIKPESKEGEDSAEHKVQSSLKEEVLAKEDEEEQPKSTIKCKGYHPINDAMWKAGEK